MVKANLPSGLRAMFESAPSWPRKTIRGTVGYSMFEIGSGVFVAEPSQ